MIKTIAVNAIALKSNGALTILNQFINNSDHNKKFIIFINHALKNLYNNTPNIQFVPIENKSYFSRIMWDFYGMKAWLKKNHIKPSCVISLQNTSVNYYNNIMQIIYFHQGIMLDNSKQNTSILYKYIYPFFVFLFYHKNTFFVVQSNWVKEQLNKKFAVSLNKIMVIKPSIPIINVARIEKLQLEHKISLFYPTSAAIHKNYTEILDALIYLKENNIEINNIALYITIERCSDKVFYQKIKQNHLEANIIFLGHLSYEQTLIYYKSCTALVFPSLIETFGLPLLEASLFNKPILTVNKSYAKETLADYSNALFLEPRNTKTWAQAILGIKSIERQSNTIKYSTNWQTLFEYIDNHTR